MKNRLDKVRRIQELRRSNSSGYVPSKKAYSRKGKDAYRSYDALIPLAMFPLKKHILEKVKTLSVSQLIYL